MKQYDQDLSWTLFVATDAQRWNIVDWVISKYFTTSTNLNQLWDIVNYINMLILLWENDRFTKIYQKYRDNIVSIMMNTSLLEQNCCRSGNIPLLKYLYENNVLEVPNTKSDLFDLYMRPFIYNQLDMVAYLDQYAPLSKEVAIEILKTSADGNIDLIPECKNYLIAKSI